MNLEELKKDYLNYLKKNENKERAIKEKAYLYSSFDHYGLSSTQMGNYFKTLNKDIAKLTHKDLYEYVNYFWQRPSHEEKELALHFLNQRATDLTIKDMPLIEKLMRESKGWVYLDSLIIPLMPEIISKNKEGYDYLRKWIKDDDFWVRRSALLAQLFFFRKGEGGDKKLFYELAESQLDESWINNIYKDKLENSRAKFFIRKAIGWMLRDMSIKDPKSVIEFVEKNKSKMAGLTVKEALRKIK